MFLAHCQFAERLQRCRRFRERIGAGIGGVRYNVQSTWRAGYYGGAVSGSGHRKPTQTTN